MMAEGENIFMIKARTEQSPGSWKGTWKVLKNNLKSYLGIVWVEDKHEEALGTCDTNKCGKNNCEHNRVGYIDFENISCFRESTERLFSSSLSAEYTTSSRDWVSGFLSRFTLTLNALKLQEQSQQLLCGLHALVSLIHPPTPYSDRTLCKRITQYPNKCGEQVLCKPRNPGGVCLFVVFLLLFFLWYVSSKNSK